VAWKISLHGVANVGQMNGLIIGITFPVYGLENKFQCIGTTIFMPETDKFLAILRFEVVFIAVYSIHIQRDTQRGKAWAAFDKLLPLNTTKYM
jgi:hypothetical protein